MRHGMWAWCALLTACQVENELRYTSTLEAPTEGVVLSEDGRHGTAGMVGSTCTLSTDWGCATADEDLPTGHERVVDRWKGKVLAVTPDHVHTLIGGSRWAQEEDVEMVDVRTVRMSSAGLLAVVGRDARCGVLVGDVLVSTPGLCGDEVRIDVDRKGVLFAATPEAGVVRIDRDGSETMEARADRVARDDVHGQIYLAKGGKAEVWAKDDRRAEVWRVSTAGPVRDLATRGDTGEVFVLVEGDGVGLVERRDGRDGRLLASSEVPTADAELRVSEDGSTLGLVRPDQVMFYRLDDGKDSEEGQVDVPRDCLGMVD